MTAFLFDSWFQFPLIAVISYLLGSVNTSIIVSKLTMHKDIRNYGSGNAGFTNAVRSMGWKKGLIVLFGDIFRCVVAVLIGQLIYCGSFDFEQGASGRLLSGAFVFLGHIYPIYFGFKGGKGALTAATTVLLYDPRVFAIGMAVFFIVVFATKYISLGSVCTAVVMPIMVFIFSYTGVIEDMSIGYTLIAAGMGGLVIFKHRSNIVRLIKGTESKFSFKGKGLMEKNSEK